MEKNSDARIQAAARCDPATARGRLELLSLMAEDYFEHYGKVETRLLAVTADGKQLPCVAGWPDDAAEAQTLAEVRAVYRARGVRTTA